jgi:hypothetical protein
MDLEQRESQGRGYESLERAGIGKLTDRFQAYCANCHHGPNGGSQKQVQLDRSPTRLGNHRTSLSTIPKRCHACRTIPKD